MIIQHAFIKGNCLIDAILLKMSGIGVIQSRFISHLLLLILSIKGKINFLQLDTTGVLTQSVVTEVTFRRSLIGWISTQSLLVINAVTNL